MARPRVWCRRRRGLRVGMGYGVLAVGVNMYDLGLRTTLTTGVAYAISLGVAILLVAAGMYQFVYGDRVFLGVSSLGVDLGGYTSAGARSLLLDRTAEYAARDLVLLDGEREWRMTPGGMGFRPDLDATIERALGVGREGPPWSRLVDQLDALWNGRATPLSANLDEARLREVVDGLARAIDRPVADAELVVTPDGEVRLAPSRVGRTLDRAAAAAAIEQSLGALSGDPIALPVTETPPEVEEARWEAARAVAERILAGPLTIRYGDRRWVLGLPDLAGWLSVRLAGDSSEAELDRASVVEYVRGLAAEIDRRPRDARLRYRSGAVQVVEDSVEGLTVDVEESAHRILAAASDEAREVELVVEVIQPAVRGADSATISLPDKLAEAASQYGDTGLDRQHNVKLAVSRLDGEMVPPGGTFSFNRELGTTRLSDGYRMAWGIVGIGNGQHATVPAEAGGICQVATALYQSAFWAGLQIDQRKGHSYWIARYGRPPLGLTGLDATVDGSGSPETLDFKFSNNTGNWLAIVGRYDRDSIYFAIHGTDPGWRIEVSEPAIYQVVPTDPTQVRIPDPSLPPGRTATVEVAHDGFTSEITRTVTRPDGTRDFHLVKSVYKPARNVVRYGPDE